MQILHRELLVPDDSFAEPDFASASMASALVSVKQVCRANVVEILPKTERRCA
jgi:hypothetical protein